MMHKLREQYRMTLDFMAHDCLGYLIGSAVCLGIGILIGVIVGFVDPQVVVDVMDAFTKMVEDAGVIGSDGSISMAGLLSNNWRAMLITVIYGFIPFIYLPTVSLVTNGILMGLLAASYAGSEVGLVPYLAGILPHGIFELSALMLAAACGTALCRNTGFILMHSPRRIPFNDLASDILRVLLFLVAPLTVAAAFVEAYVTPVIMALFM